MSFLKKPISEGSDEIGNLWQHIFRWRAQNEDLWQHVIRWRAQNDGYSSIVSSQQESLKRGYEFMNHGEEPPLRKQRLVWTEELDSLFVEVVNYLGKKDAVPKKILEKMKMHRSELSLTKEQVGSHLRVERHAVTSLIENGSKNLIPQRSPIFELIQLDLAMHHRSNYFL
ncbi:hypothetical protein K1719_016557 [Acacia pycnantha]|nr:hypothetical protein K1719_016557 [Acacia pycnantha]